MIPPTATIAVVITTCDRPDRLRRALATVRSQRTPTDQVIVVDDGTEPTASAIVWEQTDGAEVVRLRGREGPSAARNAGLRACSTDLVTFLDDDDELPDDAVRAYRVGLARLAGAGLERPAGLLGAMQVLAPDGSPRAVRRSPTVLAGTHYGLEPLAPDLSWFAKQTLLVSTDVLREVGGFDVSHHGREWTDLLLRLTATHALLAIDHPVRVFVAHGDGRVSDDPVRRARSHRQLRRDHVQAHRLHPKGAARQSRSQARRILRDRPTASMRAWGQFAVDVARLGVARATGRPEGGGCPAPRPPIAISLD